MKLKHEKTDLDHHVWKLLKRNSLEQKRILVALSGGVDSVALLRVLVKSLPAGQLGACYFHHGEDSNQEYRKAAQEFCEKLCDDLGVSFFPLHGSALAKSEAEYREYRYQALRQLMIRENFDILATGHHRDDLLETRLLRLIRGTGVQGLRSMQDYRDTLLRPFLDVTKSELRKYLQWEDIPSLEDPSNESLDPLRNWLRNSWLQALEEKSPGALGSLARSLETLVTELDERPWGDLLSQNESYKTQGLSRAYYLTLGVGEQKRLLAQYLYALGKRDFSQSHLEEAQKRLDNSQKVITFKVGGCYWQINAEQIKVQS